MVVDSHAHLLPPVRMMKLIKWMRRTSPDHPIPDDTPLEVLLDQWRALGISRVWNFAHAIFPDETADLNEWNFQLGRAHPDLIVPIGTCHPLDPDPIAVIARGADHYGFIGFKFHPFIQRFTPWDDRYMPVWEAIARHRRLVIFHTGFERHYDAPLPLAGFTRILDAFPELVVVFAHANFPRVAEAFAMLERHPRLYVDTVHAFSRHVTGWVAAGEARRAHDELRAGVLHRPDRVMFGSDHPAGAGSLAEIYADARAFGLPSEVERQILGDTAVALMDAAIDGSRQMTRPKGGMGELEIPPSKHAATRPCAG
jgi:predicted TIM-barrel fold metal-dependent hydrolase